MWYTDLWQLPENLLTSSLSTSLERNFFARVAPEKRPKVYRESLGTDTESADATAASPSVASSRGDPEKQDRPDTKAEPVTGKDKLPKPKGKKNAEPKYDGSLVKALHNTFFWRWWIAGALKLASDTMKTTTPLVTRLLLTWLTETYIYQRLSDSQKASGILSEPQGIVGSLNGSILEICLYMSTGLWNWPCVRYLCYARYALEVRRWGQSYWIYITEIASLVRKLYFLVSFRL